MRSWSDHLDNFCMRTIWNEKRSENFLGFESKTVRLEMYLWTDNPSKEFMHDLFSFGFFRIVSSMFRPRDSSYPSQSAPDPFIDLSSCISLEQLNILSG